LLLFPYRLSLWTFGHTLVYYACGE